MNLPVNLIYYLPVNLRSEKSPDVELVDVCAGEDELSCETNSMWDTSIYSSRYIQTCSNSSG